jgi:hypothetical protein
MDMLKINVTNASPGDTLVYNGFSWNPASNGTISVNGKTGNIQLTTSDIPEGNGFYFTSERVESVVKSLDFSIMKNVKVSNPQEGELLTYTDGYWINTPFHLSNKQIVTALGYTPASSVSPKFDEVTTNFITSGLLSTNLLQVQNAGLVKNLNAELVNSKPASFYAEQSMVLICSDEITSLDITDYHFKMPFASQVSKLKIYFSSNTSSVDLAVSIGDINMNLTVSTPMDVIYLTDVIVAEDTDIKVKVVNPGTNTIGMKINLYYSKV